uniref:RING-type domain-containing protein n=1 Tax=Mycena chlorophos TaxID=658473 RepID=A0ABQ0LA44_MYCCL|nr:predicted protein [Mycena chlorophos]
MNPRIPECPHSFCVVCLNGWLAEENHCPTCDINIFSRPLRDWETLKSIRQAYPTWQDTSVVVKAGFPYIAFPSEFRLVAADAVHPLDCDTHHSPLAPLFSRAQPTILISTTTVYQRRTTRSGLPFGLELPLAAAVTANTDFSLQAAPPPQSLDPDAHEPGQEVLDADQHLALLRQLLFEDPLTDDASSGTESGDEDIHPHSLPALSRNPHPPHAVSHPGSSKNNNTHKSNVRRAASRAQLAEQQGSARKAVHQRHRDRGQVHAIQTAADALNLPHSGPAWIGDRNAPAPVLHSRASGSEPRPRPRPRPAQSIAEQTGPRNHPHPRRSRPDALSSSAPPLVKPPTHPLPPKPTWVQHPNLPRSVSSPSGSLIPGSPPATMTPGTTSTTPQAPQLWPHGYGMAGPPLPQAAVDKLVGRKCFKHVNWSGDVALPMVDAQGRVVGVLGGTPADVDGWGKVVDAAHQILMKTAPKLKVPEADRCHRRAQTPFIAVAAGVSHGGGQLRPGVLQHNKTNLRLTAALLQDRNFKRIAGFTRGVFRTWAPRLYGYYADTRERLFKWRPSLRHGWPFEDDDGIFAAATFNFGCAVSCRHLDFGNLAWGWCAITALGDFDPDLGGHLILWELGLIIRFPPGSSILIPSAAIHHSNTAIQPHEHRCSFIQYTAGGLFRWVDNGCKPNEKFEAEASDAEKAARAARAATRWVDGLAMLEQSLPSDSHFLQHNSLNAPSGMRSLSVHTNKPQSTPYGELEERTKASPRRASAKYRHKNGEAELEKQRARMAALRAERRANPTLDAQDRARVKLANAMYRKNHVESISEYDRARRDKAYELERRQAEEQRREAAEDRALVERFTREEAQK